MSRMKLAAGTAALVLAALAARPLLARWPGSSSASVREPAAIAALSRMGAYLDKLEKFQVHALISRDQVLGDGQKLQFDSRVSLLASRPNRLRIDVQGDRHERTLFYDGRTFALWAPRQRSYAAMAAPSSIRELADTLEARYDIEMPLVDLFRWGDSDVAIDQLTGARVVGSSEVDGVACIQYAFRQSGLDWQVWIQDGDQPLPRKVVLTTLTDNTRPQHSATYVWDLTPIYDGGAFVFAPPAGARRVDVSEVKAPRIKSHE